MTLFRIVSDIICLQEDVDIANDVINKNEKLLKETLAFALSDNIGLLNSKAKADVYTVIGKVYTDIERFKITLSEALERQAQEI